MVEVLVGEIMLLEETDFGVYGFAILRNHAHAVPHLLEGSNLSFKSPQPAAPAHEHSLPPSGAAQTVARGRILVSKLV